MPRSTRSTIEALKRLCEAADIKLTRDGQNFVPHIGVSKALGLGPPSGKKSARALALAVSAVRHRPDWEEIREAVAYDPGIRRGDLRVNVPRAGMAGWEEDELTRLAITEEP